MALSFHGTHGTLSPCIRLRPFLLIPSFNMLLFVYEFLSISVSRLLCMIPLRYMLLPQTHRRSSVMLSSSDVPSFTCITNPPRGYYTLGARIFQLSGSQLRALTRTYKPWRLSVYETTIPKYFLHREQER